MSDTGGWHRYVTAGPLDARTRRGAFYFFMLSLDIVSLAMPSSFFIVSLDMASLPIVSFFIESFDMLSLDMVSFFMSSAKAAGASGATAKSAAINAESRMVFFIVCPPGRLDLRFIR